jgi:putative hydrolase of the HAD superfamily
MGVPRPTRVPPARAADGPHCLLVDLDDTLFDHVGASDRALRRFRGRHSALRQWSPEELLRRHAGHLEALHAEVLEGRLSLDGARAERMRRLFEDAGVNLTGGEPLQRARELRVHYQALRRAVPGAAPFLRYAHRRATISVVTNNLLEEQQEKLRFLGVADLVDDLVTSEEAGVAKPDPGIFAIALRRAGASRRGAVMLGDSFASDVVGARQARLPVVWFNRYAAPPPPGHRPVPELRSLAPPSRAWRAVASAWAARPVHTGGPV